MAHTPVNWTEKRKSLRAKRDSLFKQFEANPWNIGTGQETKKLDDQLAECEEHLALQRSAISRS